MSKPRAIGDGSVCHTDAFVTSDINVSLTTDSYDDCDHYDATAADEVTNTECLPKETVCQRRHHNKRTFEDFLSWSAGWF